MVESSKRRGRPRKSVNNNPEIAPVELNNCLENISNDDHEGTPVEMNDIVSVLDDMVKSVSDNDTDDCIILEEVINNSIRTELSETEQSELKETLESRDPMIK